MSMKPLRLKLAYGEALGLKVFLQYVNSIKIDPNTPNEAIVLMEFSVQFYTKCFSHGLKKPKALVTYEFPLSVARILHNQLQFYPTNSGLQSILSGIDQLLTNLELKPAFVPETN